MRTQMAQRIRGRSMLSGTVVLLWAFIGGTGTAASAVAVPAAGGEQLWANHFVPGDTPHDSALSPDGSTLYVTGCAGGVGGCGGSDFETVAFRVSTGAIRWIARFDSQHLTDTAVAVGVSPDGARVFVTGHSTGSTGSEDIVTIGYNATTGRRLWSARYDGAGHGVDTPTDLAVTPDGTKVLVTGSTALVGGGGLRDHRLRHGNRCAGLAVALRRPLRERPGPVDRLEPGRFSSVRDR